MQITGDVQRYGPATTASWREALLQVSVGCDDGDLRGTDDINFPLGRDKSSFSPQVLDNGARSASGVMLEICVAETTSFSSGA